MNFDTAITLVKAKCLYLRLLFFTFVLNPWNTLNYSPVIFTFLAIIFFSNVMTSARCHKPTKNKYLHKTSTIFSPAHTASRRGSKIKISPLHLENNYEVFEIYYFQFGRWKLLTPPESYIKFLL